MTSKNTVIGVVLAGIVAAGMPLLSACAPDGSVPSSPPAVSQVPTPVDEPAPPAVDPYAGTESGSDNSQPVVSPGSNTGEVAPTIPTPPYDPGNTLGSASGLPEYPQYDSTEGQIHAMNGN